MSRFFISNDNIKNNIIKISGDDAKHIKNVLRLKKGENLTICDGNGKDYYCSIKSFIENEILLDIISFNKSNTEPKIKVTLFQSLPKSDKMELIIQKCVELGIDEIVPIYTERSIIKVDKKEKELKKINRWQKISESAAKQSNRGKIPIIKPIIKFNTAIENAKIFENAIIAYENEYRYSLKNFLSDFNGKNIALFIGPEGGFSKDEINLAINNNIVPITLGKRILRTETAAFSALSIIMYELD